jgi:hypothetical protein
MFVSLNGAVEKKGSELEIGYFSGTYGAVL